MRHMLLLVTVAAMMVMTISGAALADPEPNAHNCTAGYISGFAPDDLQGGQEGLNASGRAKEGIRGDDLESFNEASANCGNNR